ncbi:MAG: hypothetical protein S4CHLAM20_13460 [Chlamydiia bacterium]|nr:hypothetical protein [Chlamydiia bacterium]
MTTVSININFFRQFYLVGDELDNQLKYNYNEFQDKISKLGELVCLKKRTLPHAVWTIILSENVYQLGRKIIGLIQKMDRQAALLLDFVVSNCSDEGYIQALKKDRGLDIEENKRAIDEMNKRIAFYRSDEMKEALTSLDESKSE